MDAQALTKLLESVRSGAVSAADAAGLIQRQATFETAGNFATVDLNRRKRCGFPEVIFGQGKTPEQVEAILRTISSQGETALATRITAETAAHLFKAFPEGRYHSVARTFQLASNEPAGPRMGKVVIITAGTSDLPVAEEARVTAEAWECEVHLIVDVGVAGLHRLLARMEEFQGADVLIVVAGMEGALPSVVGGLADCPVIAIPTSIGYGANFGGLAALLGMLNSCASNVVAVNIDAGFNGGHVAGLIARRAALARLEGRKAR
jgi:NCAIR mutase (PurE)-related protein